MKILRVIARLNVGGPARHVLLAISGLQGRGHETLLVYGRCAPDEASMEAVVDEYRIPAVAVGDLRRRLGLAADLRAFVKLLRLINGGRPDVVHTHTAKAGAVGRLAAFVANLGRRPRERAAVVHTFHGHVLDGYFLPWRTALVRAAERMLARLTDRIIVLSPAQEIDIVNRFRIAPRAKVSIVHLGLNLEPLFDVDGNDTSMRARLGVSEQEFVVGYIGRLVPIKNLGLLIEAFGEFRRGRPGRLLIAGDGPERSSLQRTIAERGLARDVLMAGWCSDLPAFYSAIDVLALSSSNEGTPVAIIEAMASGRPIVATAVGGVPDIVQDGITGVLVSPGNLEGFTAALRQLADDRARRIEMGRAARLSVRRKYSVDRLIDDLEAVYVAAVAARRRLADTRSGP